MNAYLFTKLDGYKEFIFYSFVTDDQRNYRVGFDNVRDSFFDSPGDDPAFDIFELIFMTTDDRSGADRKISLTIAHIIRDFFIEKEIAIIYKCYDRDKQQAARFRYFKQWFEMYANGNELIHEQAQIETENTVLYVGLLVQNNHPKCEQILTIFREMEAPQIRAVFGF